MKKYSEKFHELITRLQVVLSDIDYAQKACLQAGRMECLLLNHLYETKIPANMNELAKVLNVSHSRVTRIMDNLVNKKLVTRKPSEEDRRCWFAIITEKGMKLAENSQKSILDQQDMILSKIPEKDIEEVYKAFKKYVDKYEEVLKETYIEV
ncbi:MAG: MarR family winged helix-turn-helix transcriptional regulator [Candidatus Cloacimonadaceae bacterium]|jgi:DNA-binding MarR family transcriptional regulator|nr:MarR family winged helix-turn-helix transcriptional regulator [Candidatus Cloacimonadota bacterium]MDY0126613.1 MarR family winged helix-turn-helix transcriptional regulator [Candidatus Cloacimonadaceae bacterium]MCB5255227.1 MarR family winged helix-turn-helix transcriptional regulator [Candidatus Cloacimonadota bacterium]MCK9177449.1 MarR family winged helix-turn-helix transcriptional regulator [Candidatus Cloacimonadota bacterium]MCK9241933.1 MarR family winged helix-turn-helix transcript